MGQSVVTGAMATCSFGVAPSTLNFLPITRVTIEGRPAGTTMDMMPMVNIPPFGMCTSLSNPTVAAATSAALGVLTPMPCIPTMAGPWKPGALKTTIGGKPALVSGSTCNCAFGGMVSITMTGAMKTTAG
ncbi:DUF4280 domain-containing protein [Nocardioides sp. W7]|uniref:DUF4280 domain-containing protein n=1 Tax=Nocardioides sp. W7 TaxID=2931390 RepID=UPI001FD336CD|nr:DUF4280 domain-containing protein [Nocardioides sp. W7]